MHLLARVIAVILGIFVAGALALFLYLALADLSSYKTDIEEGMLDATGLELDIGEFALEVGADTVLTAAQVSVVNPEYPEASQVALIGRLHVVIDNWSFFSDAVEIKALEVEDLRLTLHQGPDGTANWKATPRQPEIPVPQESEAERDLVLQAVRLDNIDISYQSSDSAASSFRLESLSVDRRPDGASGLELKGAVTADPVDTLFAGSATVSREGERIYIAGGLLSIPGADAGIDGWLDNSGSDPQAGITLTASGPSLAEFGANLAASGLPALPFEFSVDVTTVPSGVELHDLRLLLGDGELLASASITVEGDRPRIQANINSPRLDLRSPPAPPDQRPAPDNSDAGERLVFSDEPLQYSWLDAADVEAEIFVNTILLNDDTLSDANVKLVLQNAALTVDPMGFRNGEGEMSGRLALKPTDGRYALELDVAASKLRLGALAAEGQDPASVPPIDARLVLSGEGKSLHEIMAGATGRLNGRQQAGQIDLQAAGVLFSDLVASILRTLNPLAESEPLTTLECGIYEVEIADGVATIEELALQSDKLTIISSGKVDLGTEAIDLTMRTKTREGLGLSLGGLVNSFLKIGGTLAAPSMGMDAAGSVTTTGAAMATGGLSVLAKGLFDRVSAESDLCTALAEPRPEQAAPAE